MSARIVIQIPPLKQIRMAFSVTGRDTEVPTRLVLVSSRIGWVRMASDPEDTFPSFDAGPVSGETP